MLCTDCQVEAGTFLDSGYWEPVNSNHWSTFKKPQKALVQQLQRHDAALSNITHNSYFLMLEQKYFAFSNVTGEAEETFSSLYDFKIEISSGR